MLRSVSFILLFVGCLFSTPAFAGGGGDIVGNGGGLAELQVTRLWSQMDRELMVCFQASNPCSLDASKRDLLSQVVDFRRSHNPKLSFIGDAGNWVFRIGKDEVTFNAHMLYQSNASGDPLPLRDLLQQTLASFLVQIGQPLNKSLQFAGALASSWKQRLFRQSGTVLGKPASLIVSQVAGPNGELVDLFAEFNGNAWSLTEPFKAAFPCAYSDSSVQILSGLFQADSYEMTVRGALEFRCVGDPALYEAKYVTVVNADTKGPEPYIDLQGIRKKN